MENESKWADKYTDDELFFMVKQLLYCLQIKIKDNKY